MSTFSKDLTALTNLDLLNLVKELNVKDFRGVFMRDGLPEKIKDKEVGIVNLDSSNNKGTHWVCYKKIKDTAFSGSRGDTLFYFDSFGLDPPEEMIKYLKQGEDRKIELSTFQIQEFNTHHCGYYCLLLLKLLETLDFQEAVLSLNY